MSLICLVKLAQKVVENQYLRPYFMDQARGEIEGGGGGVYQRIRKL